MSLGNVNALADAIIRLLTNQGKTVCMGREGRRMAVDLFDERLVFERVKAEYARLLKEKRISFSASATDARATGL